MKWWHLSSRENEFERPAVASVLPAGRQTPAQTTAPPSALPRRPKCCTCCLPLVAVLKRKNKTKQKTIVTAYYCLIFFPDRRYFNAEKLHCLLCNASLT